MKRLIILFLLLWLGFGTVLLIKHEVTRNEKHRVTFFNALKRVKHG